MSNRKTHDPIWLQAHGYDGLWNPEGPCGCGGDDYYPCNEGPFKDCIPATLDDERNRGDMQPFAYYPAKRWMFLAK